VTRFKWARCRHHSQWNKKMDWYGVIPMDSVVYRAPLFPSMLLAAGDDKWLTDEGPFYLVDEIFAI
jgi:hypothetical protein